MLSEREYQERLDRIQALRQQVADRLSGSLVSNPALAEELNKQIDDLVAASAQADAAVTAPRDPPRARRAPTGGSPSSSASARTRRGGSVTSRSRRAWCPTTRTSTPNASSRS